MCVKGGMGSFNLFRQYFPEQFNKRAQTERQIGHSCLKKCFLDKLPEDAGRKLKVIPQELTVTGAAALQVIQTNFIRRQHAECLKIKYSLERERFFALFLFASTLTILTTE